MSVVRRHLERAGAASAGLAPWAATGDPVRDLPDCFSGMLGTRIASASIDVSSSSGLSLEMAAEEAFSTALDRLGSSPVRVWAFLPSITGADQEGMNRYMRMNRGRGRAYRAKDLKWFPAGTGVGHSGRLLVVHALSFDAAARPVENPRQVPAWRYSAAYGPQSPPFSRGVAVGDMFLAAGTAAVVGEGTVHSGDLLAQWVETLRNLQAVSESAGVVGYWRSIRAYVREVAHVEVVTDLALQAFGAALDGVLLADLCRDDLLVEVEGVRNA